ncbi:M4 family metallopeptidase [Massilia sp. CCM 9210]|uniref:M4 family metallopeptidase n=1 Tax=Massilia scottii TaxID=3057166 RepID=UPI0027966CAB|nr:M4 family metallopeptidase [Massilia sp. CCM 9210]MDQ1817081.1 M4 family metallopeptidase [Massilia sp. CCM 9210]
MNFRKTLLAASIAALPLMMVGQALASAPIMAGPTALHSPQQGQALVAKLAATRATHGLDADHGFSITVQHPGVIGTRISRAAHTYKGVRVFQSESVVVTNDAGEIVSESISDRRSGLGQGSGGNAALRARSAGLNVVPQIQSAAAIDMVVKKVSPNGVHHVPPSAELIIYPSVVTKRAPGALNKSEAQLNALDLVEEVSDYELAYLVKTRMMEGIHPVYYDTIVSAADGRVIKQWKALQTVAGTGKSQYNGTVPLNTSLSGSTYSLKDPSRGTGGTHGMMAITNANKGTSAGAVYTNSTNDWGDGLQYNGGSTTNANGQTAAVNAMWGLMNTYDTLKNVLGWQSLDGNNTSTYIAAHVNSNYDNAYYSDACKCMFIGDGGSMFTSLGSIDVIGHEMGHGVTNATSDLTYSGESGGLNESSSDITGEVVEAYARAGGTGSVIPNTGNDWMMGKEIAKSGNPLRWMYKPSLDGKSPNAWSSTIKNLDVHYNSGPNNRMFYFLSQGSNATSSSNYYSQYLVKSPAAMTGIGTDKAFRIWFKAATTKFTASTNYADARNKVLAAAQELYGVGSKEAIAVTRAYAAINVGADIDETTTPGGGVTISSQPSSVTVAAGATATFSVTATGGTAPYKYQWLRNGTAIAGATSATYSLTAQTADSGAVFSVRVTDSATSPTTATSANATLTVSGGGGGTTERIVNGGFESGTNGWAGTTGVIGSYSGQTAYEGTRFAWLGGNGVTRTETITQSVAIPAAATAATLSFALHIDTAENENVVYDKLVVTVKNAGGTVLGTLATYTNLNKAAGYQMRTFNLLPYKGQTVTLSFAMREDSSLQTSFVVDKVSLLTQ